MRLQEETEGEKTLFPISWCAQLLNDVLQRWAFFLPCTGAQVKDQDAVVLMHNMKYPLLL